MSVSVEEIPESQIFCQSMCAIVILRDTATGVILIFGSHQGMSVEYRFCQNYTHIVCVINLN